MPHSLELGPLSIPLALLIPLAAVLIGQIIGQWQLRRLQPGLSFDGAFLWQSIIPALIVARVVYVIQYWPSYAGTGWAMLDVRDGGFNLWAGVLCAWLLALRAARKTPVLRRPLMLAMFCLTLTGLFGQEVLLRPATAPQQMPVTQFRTLEGDSVMLQQFAGKPTIITLWATWCPHCVREMPVLQEAQQKHPDINIVMLNQGEQREVVQSFLQRRQFTLNNVLLDEQRQAAKFFGLRGLPSALFLDANGRLVDVRVGALSRATLEQRIQAMRQPPA
ncbi:MAG: redoxin family protein [Lautropia sp.]|nr:redoxin family protein [Lautropia sp.]